jgi:hypothetical protein
VNDDQDIAMPIPFGVCADTGRPLNPLAEATVAAEFGRVPEATAESIALESRGDSAGHAFAVQGGIDAGRLDQAGWGVIFSPSVGQDIKDALKPLLDHRKSQADPFVIFDGPNGYLNGDTARDWLKRRKVRMDTVDPANGVPYYLLLVGPPEEMSFEFQYSLDIFWGVGRLWFDTAEEFRRYADSVVHYERPENPVPTRRKGLLFATEHDFDEATNIFMRQVAKPLAWAQGGALARVWTRPKFGLDTLLGEDATRANLSDALRGARQGPPALLVSGTHGLQCPLGDPRQRETQGAIVCQDWGGFGSIEPSHWFAAADVPADAKLHGMMHFLFACHGGGCPERDNFDRLNDQPVRIAEKPFFSRLPQKFLSHPDGGALAVLAHIERAWAYSFQGDRGNSQIQGFVDVIARLLAGERIGQATDAFNIRWAAIAAELSDLQNDLARGAEVSTARLGNLWVSRDDARNYMILGDPAVRLRVEDMAA